MMMIQLGKREGKARLPMEWTALFPKHPLLILPFERCPMAEFDMDGIGVDVKSVYQSHANDGQTEMDILLSFVKGH